MEYNKYCYVSCGDRCNCKTNLMRPTRKFEDKYEVLGMYQYLNHPYYENFISYLSATNKIALIFCKSDDELFNIVKSDYILTYKVSGDSGKDKILKELKKDFDAYEARYTIEPEFLREFRISEIIIDEEFREI